MKLSPEGKRLIFSFEGKLRKISDGRYIAYRCPADVWTIFAGCTSGVTEGMIVTEEQGEELFQKEIAKHEATVARLVPVDLTQYEFAAMVSLSFNIGAAGFERSSVLRRLNNGNRAGAAKAFEMWTKANVKGRKIDLPGLVSRRKREAALFLKPVEAPEAPAMPQAVAEVKEVSKPTVAAVAAVAATAAPIAAPVLIPPAVPQIVTEGLGNASAWRGVGETIWTFRDWAIAQPTMASAVTIGVASFYLWSRKKAAQ